MHASKYVNKKGSDLLKPFNGNFKHSLIKLCRRALETNDMCFFLKYIIICWYLDSALAVAITIEKVKFVHFKLYYMIITNKLVKYQVERPK